jgi:hypothetical protein
MLASPTGLNAYWIICLGGLACSTILFPLVVIYAPPYSFPFALGGFVMAGYAVGQICELLKKHGYSLAAAAWMLAALVVNAPSLISYYSDGSRPDMRAAAAYVREHWKPGDAVAGFSVGRFAFYAPGLEPRFPITNDAAGVAELERLARTDRRFWIVMETARPGLDPELLNWLFAHAVHKYRAQKRRFDYQEFTQDVFLYDPALDRQAAVRRNELWHRISCRFMASTAGCG